ncbi:response regulator [Paenibacillus harenae]|uniref:response regulator n=1 Tax=Paenibacillus harenae TaxID=306543 RepID=UPI00040BC098|nr:response regulator transcription factor [Paenibacillus harenae]
MIQVLVADDQRLMRDGLSTLISLDPEIKVVGTASNGKEAYEKAIGLHPDVVLMDIRMPMVDGVEGTRLIRCHLPEMKVLVLTTFEDIELIVMALEQGASGYLLKDMPSETIISAIHTIHSGGTVLHPSITALILEEWRNREIKGTSDHSNDPRLSLLEQLSVREMEVLQLIGRGLNNKEIADTLVITEGTVKNHVSSVISKLELRDRTQVAIFAVQQGITVIET